MAAREAYSAGRDFFVNLWKKADKPISGTAARVVDAVGTGLGGAAGAVSGLAHPVKKPLAIAGVVGAAVAGFGALAAVTRGNRRKETREEIRNAADTALDMPPVMDANLQMMNQPTLAGMPLVTDGPQVQKVLARRGMGQQAGVDATIPSMSVVPEASVQDLNAPAVGGR